ncbi:CCR4-NOT transcription complex subunit 9 [Schistosoma japonicum]|uniref:CCR4-NOT transcription complex subunit 9 n=1 Tax=Schistosoma japonicum TaxID=6182 RepID=A0A4Z2DGH1_SCHJA|nr:CCR4-NOT transcription complex subunit 9 [Schistosoma japonicum]
MEIPTMNSTIHSDHVEYFPHSHSSKHSPKFNKDHFLSQEYTTINLNDTHLNSNFDVVHSTQQQLNLNSNNMNHLFSQIIYPHCRKHALIEICKSIDNNPWDIGLFIYSRPGIVAALLLEIVRHYPIDKTVPLASGSYEVICSIIAIFQQTVLNKKARRNFVSTESFLFPDLVPYSNEKIAHEGGIEGNHEQHTAYFTVNDLFIQTLKALNQCTTEVGKNMALILLARLLNSQYQRNRLCHTPSLFNQLISSLTEVIGYMVRKFSTKIQHQFMNEIQLYGRYSRTTLMKSKRLLKFALECFNQLIIDPRLRYRLRDSLPIELRSNLFSVLLLHDQDVQLWLERMWFQLGWDKVN